MFSFIMLCLGNFVEEIPYVPVPQESVVRLRMTPSGVCYSDTIELLRYNVSVGTKKYLDNKHL